MVQSEQDKIIGELYRFLGDRTYPCVAARAAMSRGHIACLVVDDFRCASDDDRILHFIYDFIRDFRRTIEPFHSAAVIFRTPQLDTERTFDSLLWQKLQSLSLRDAGKFRYDKRVNSDPMGRDFSFSLGEEAFFIIGLHPASSRRSRRFKYPAIVFNPHIQFEVLREKNRYEKMKEVVRHRDLQYSGSVNPMLDDFGHSSEARQYSGRQYDTEWKCPLRVTHAKTNDASPPQHASPGQQEGIDP